MKRLLYFLRNILFLFAVLFTFAGCNLLDGNSKTGNYTVKGKVVNRLGEAVYGVDVCASGTSSNTGTWYEFVMYFLSVIPGTFPNLFCNDLANL